LNAMTWCSLSLVLGVPRNNMAYSVYAVIIEDSKKHVLYFYAIENLVLGVWYNNIAVLLNIDLYTCVY
jgi:hypothetical protein